MDKGNIVLIILGVIIAAAAANYIYEDYNDNKAYNRRSSGEDHVITATITHKERVAFKRGAASMLSESIYLVYGSVDGDPETWCMIDTPTRLDTSDWYGAIKIGATYELTIRGDRDYANSHYPNIVSYREVAERVD